MASPAAFDPAGELFKGPVQTRSAHIREAD